MHTYFTLTNQGLLFLLTVLMGHVVSYLIDFQCPVLATASNVSTGDRPRVLLWTDLGRFLLTIWPQAVAVLLLSMQYDMLDRSATGGAQGTRRLRHQPWYQSNPTYGPVSRDHTDCAFPRQASSRIEFSLSNGSH